MQTRNTDPAVLELVLTFFGSIGVLEGWKETSLWKIIYKKHFHS